jgi:hypothetical protein
MDDVDDDSGSEAEDPAVQRALLAAVVNIVTPL